MKQAIVQNGAERGKRSVHNIDRAHREGSAMARGQVIKESKGSCHGIRKIKPFKQLTG